MRSDQIAFGVTRRDLDGWMSIADAQNAAEELAKVVDEVRDMLAARAVGNVLRDTLVYARDLVNTVGDENGRVIRRSPHCRIEPGQRLAGGKGVYGRPLFTHSKHMRENVDAD
jgi:hypothetical protein